MHKNSIVFKPLANNNGFNLRNHIKLEWSNEDHENYLLEREKHQPVFYSVWRKTEPGKKSLICQTVGRKKKKERERALNELVLYL